MTIISPPAYAELLSLCRSASSRLVVLTGAGLSTESGIPDYRSPAGSYSKGHRPMTHDEFVGSHAARVRYWSRSMRGWRPFASKQPNAGHHSLAALERAGVVTQIVTQNVDGLHTKAGSRDVLELHGTSHSVSCMACGESEPRRSLQARLVALNYWQLASVHPMAADLVDLDAREAELRADGDADVRLGAAAEAAFRIPPCRHCGGVLKPDVTFFGDIVPRARSRRAMEAVRQASALLVAGTSLSTLSAFRLADAAARDGTPLAVVNRGETRLDRPPGVPHLKVEAGCGETLSRLVDDLI